MIDNIDKLKRTIKGDCMTECKLVCLHGPIELCNEKICECNRNINFANFFCNIHCEGHNIIHLITDTFFNFRGLEACFLKIKTLCIWTSPNKIKFFNQITENLVKNYSSIEIKDFQSFEHIRKPHFQLLDRESKGLSSIWSKLVAIYYKMFCKNL